MGLEYPKSPNLNSNYSEICKSSNKQEYLQ